MEDPVLKLADTLEITHSEWLLTENPFLNVLALRQACLWEYGRESAWLGTRIDDVFRFAQLQLPEHSMYEISEFLHDFAGECIAVGFEFLPVSSTAFESSAAASELSTKLFDIHKAIGRFDWRFLLSPLFPELPWSKVGGTEISASCTLSWSGPSEIWAEHFRKESQTTLFKDRSYYVSRKGMDFEFRLNKPLASAVDLGARLGLAQDEEIPIAVIAIAIDDLSNRPTINLAQRVVADLLLESAPGSSHPSIFTLRGRTALDSATVRMEAGSSLILAGLPISNGQLIKHQLLFLPLAGFTPKQRLPLLYASVLELEKRGLHAWRVSEVLPLKEDCIKALKSLGASRIRPHLNPVLMNEFWKKESKRLGIVKISGKKLEFHKERKTPSSRPIYSNWRHFEKAAHTAKIISEKLFPTLQD